MSESKQKRKQSNSLGNKKLPEVIRRSKKKFKPSPALGDGEIRKILDRQSNCCNAGGLMGCFLNIFKLVICFKDNNKNMKTST
jgi:hypothetical protein